MEIIWVVGHAVPVWRALGCLLQPWGQLLEGGVQGGKSAVHHTLLPMSKSGKQYCDKTKVPRHQFNTSRHNPLSKPLDNWKETALCTHKVLFSLTTVKVWLRTLRYQPILHLTSDDRANFCFHKIFL